MATLGPGARATLQAHPSRLLLGCGLALIGATSSWASPDHRRFDLAAGQLPASVARIGSLAGVDIVTSDPALLIGTARPIHLDGTAGQALRLLLAGTRARAVQVGPASWRIEARPPPARQPAPPSTSPADIIVSGSKRNAALSDYPASVALISGDRLSRFGSVPDNDALVRAFPVLSSTDLGPGRDKLFLRGIADSSFVGSGAALVGRYMGDLRLTYNAPDPDLRLYDISAVEILQGAQGSLYGAGSMAGLIRVTPHAPEFGTWGAEAWAGGTSVAHGAAGGDIGGMINIPVTDDRTALRVLAYAGQDGGYIDDVGRGLENVNRTTTKGGRAALRSRVGADWLIDLNGIAQDIRNRDAQYADQDLPPLNRSSIAAQPSSNLFRSGAMVLSGPVGQLRFVSTSAIVRQSIDQRFQTSDGFGLAIYNQHDDIRLLSEEARLSGEHGKSIEWVSGLSILSSRAIQLRNLTAAGAVQSLGSVHSNIRDLTAFGEITIHATTHLNLTTGVRLSEVRLSGVAGGSRVKSGSPSRFNDVRHERFLVPSFALAWTPVKSLLIFARYSQGYRPGGLTASGIVQRYDADRIRSLEAGMRLSPASRQRIFFELAGVTSRWRSIQADVLGTFGLPMVQNIGDARINTISVSMDWEPAKSVEAKISATVARGAVESQDQNLSQIVRTALPDVARDTFVASLDYHIMLDRGCLPLTVGTRINHVAHSALGSGIELSQIRQGGYWLTSAGAEIRAGSNRFTLDVENLLDARNDSFAFGEPDASYKNQFLTPLRPRRIRVGMNRQF
jgi:iron complex outermembrane recepter protein